MTKILFSIFLLLNTLNALKIKVVEDNNNKESYMKDGRLVLNPMDKVIIKPIDSKVLKIFKSKILESYNPKLAKIKVVKKAK